MKKTVTAMLLGVFSMSAFAHYDVKILENQRQKIDTEITTRNQLLDEIKPKPYTHDMYLLSSVNSYELSTESTLQSLEDFLIFLNKYNDKSNDELKAKLVDSLSQICNLQLLEMVAVKENFENEKIKNRIGVQTDNIRDSCHMLGGVVVKDGKLVKVY